MAAYFTESRVSIRELNWCGSVHRLRGRDGGRGLDIEVSVCSMLKSFIPPAGCHKRSMVGE
jgi:hypothetical protein